MTTALGALLSAPVGTFSYAQTQETPSVGESTESVMEEKSDLPSKDSAVNEPAANKAEVVAGDAFALEQAEDEVAATYYIGEPVYNHTDEKVGEINDLIFTKAGGVQTAIIGVGGFLGIGEKDVAVHFEAIEFQEVPESAAVRLVIDASKEQLEESPKYVTKAEKVAEARRLAAQTEMQRQATELPVSTTQSSNETTGSISE